MAMKKENIVIVQQTYIDGQLVSETAKCIKNEPGLWNYIIPGLVGIMIYWQIVAWG